MLFTDIEEVRQILPTSKWTDLTKLESLLEEEEQNTLLPILGDSLYEHLQEQYDKLIKTYVNVSPGTMRYMSGSGNEEEPSRTLVSVLRTCQRIALYKVLANNSGLFALSFNEGGGLNASSADNYDEANDKAMQRYVKDAWNKAHRSVDSLLKQLESDARGAREFTNLWKSSRYFYYQGGLLFTTAVQLQQFLNIDESRERFIQLVPRIRYAQDVYIRPRLGRKLLADLIEMKYGEEPAVEQQSTAGEPAGEPQGTGDGDQTAEPQDTGDGDQTAEPQDTVGEVEEPKPASKETLEAILPEVLMSLALYVESSEKSMARPLSFNEGEMQIELARQYIKQHPEDFAYYYCAELKDLLPPPPPPASDDSDAEDEDKHHKPHHHDPHHHCDPHHHDPHHHCDPYVLDLGALTHS